MCRGSKKEYFTRIISLTIRINWHNDTRLSPRGKGRPDVQDFFYHEQQGNVNTADPPRCAVRGTTYLLTTQALSTTQGKNTQRTWYTLLIPYYFYTTGSVMTEICPYNGFRRLMLLILTIKIPYKGKGKHIIAKDKEQKKKRSSNQETITPRLADPLVFVSPNIARIRHLVWQCWAKCSELSSVRLLVSSTLFFLFWILARCSSRAPEQRWREWRPTKRLPARRRLGARRHCLPFCLECHCSFILTRCCCLILFILLRL